MVPTIRPMHYYAGAQVPHRRQVPPAGALDSYHIPLHPGTQYGARSVPRPGVYQHGSQQAPPRGPQHAPQFGAQQTSSSHHELIARRYFTQRAIEEFNNTGSKFGMTLRQISKRLERMEQSLERRDKQMERLGDRLLRVQKESISADLIPLFQESMARVEVALKELSDLLQPLLDSRTAEQSRFSQLLDPFPLEGSDSSQAEEVVADHQVWRSPAKRPCDTETHEEVVVAGLHARVDCAPAKGPCDRRKSARIRNRSGD